MTNDVGNMARMDIAATIDARPLGRAQVVLVALIFLVMLLDGFDIALLSFLVSPISREWHTATGELAPALAAALLGTVMGAAVGGVMADRIGRRWTLVGSVFIFGVGTLLCSRTAGIAELIALRLMSGLGYGAAFPCATALLAEWLPLRTRSRAVSIMNIGVPGGGMMGALLSPWLFAEFGWRASFVLAGMTTLAVGILLIALLPESIGYLAARADSGRRIAGLLHRVLPDKPSFAPTTKWVVSEAVHSQSSDADDRLFSRPNLRVNIGLWSTFFMTGLGVYAFTNWMPTLLVKLGMPLSAAIRGSMSFYAGAIIITYLAGAATARAGSRATLLGLGSAAVLMFGWIAATLLRPGAPSAANYLQLIVGMGCAGGCLAGIYATLFSVSASAYPTRYRGSGVGACVTAGRLGGIASIFLVGTIATNSMAFAFFAVVGAAIFGILGGTLLIDRHVQRISPKFPPDELTRRNAVTHGPTSFTSRE